MDEARRFLRYVTPGLVYGVLTFLWLFIVFPEWTNSQIRDLAAKDSIGVALAGLFASGVLGYVFATCHHLLHWRFDEGILDHRPLINRLRKNGQMSNPPNNSEVTRTEALQRSFALWYQCVKNGSITDAADKKVSSLGDQTHGLCAARVASLFALVTALLLCPAIGAINLGFIPMIRFALMIMLAT